VNDSQWIGRNKYGGHRARRGDMTPIILELLKDKPMHGYEIISRLEAKSHGMWRPSAGSVYPTLQLLEEQELIVGSEEDSKKVYRLTDKGKQEAEKVEESFKERWEEREIHAQTFKDLKSVFFETMAILRKIASQNSETKNQQVKQILNEAKDKLDELSKN
jgi:DNA-binding PadR family transcriptional regulator